MNGTSLLKTRDGYKWLFQIGLGSNQTQTPEPTLHVRRLTILMDVLKPAQADRTVSMKGNERIEQSVESIFKLAF